MRRRGFSLPELLVYVVVLPMFLLGVHAAFGLGLRCFHDSQARSSATHSAQVALNLINRTLAGASGSLANGVSVQVSPPGLLFASAVTNNLVFDSDNTTGNVIWQKWVCIYLDSASRSLRMSEQALATPAQTLPAPPAFATMTALPSRVVARDIDSANFSLSTAVVGGLTVTTVNYLMTVRTSASVATRGDAVKVAGLTLGGRFTLRN